MEYPTIDIMNHAGATGRRGNTPMKNPFDYEEFKIMTRTTFKSVFGGKEPDAATFKAMGEAQAKAAPSSIKEVIEEMDKLGYEKLVLSATKMWSYWWHHEHILDYPIDDLGEAVAESNGRLIGGASYSPFRIEDSLKEVEKGVKEYGFKYVWFHPLSYGLAPNDRRFYPLYAKCAELDIAVGFQVGHSAEPLPSDVGRPMLADDVAIEFPYLRINLSHTGWPWVDEWCSMLWRHPNVYGDISAYFPKSLDDRLVRFMNSSRGRDKVLFGTNGLGLERCRTEFLDMDLKEETKTMVLHDNAVRFLKLEE